MAQTLGTPSVTEQLTRMEDIVRSPATTSASVANAFRPVWDASATLAKASGGVRDGLESAGRALPRYRRVPLPRW